MASGGGRNELTLDLGSLPDQATGRGPTVRKGFRLRAALEAKKWSCGVCRSLAVFCDRLVSPATSSRRGIRGLVGAVTSTGALTNYDFWGSWVEVIVYSLSRCLHDRSTTRGARPWPG